MPTPIALVPGDEDEGINFRLWLGILLPPIAALTNTVVGYMVSNYDCALHNRHLVLLVNLVSALICIVAGITAYSTRQKYERRQDDESASLLHTRRFMMGLGIAFAAGGLIFVTAGTISSLVLRSCDL